MIFLRSNERLLESAAVYRASSRARASSKQSRYTACCKGVYIIALLSIELELAGWLYDSNVPSLRSFVMTWQHFD